MSMIALLLLLDIPLIVTVGILAIKHFDQASRDRQRKTYKLAFPSDLEAERVSAWIRSISGTLKTGSFRFLGAPTVAFETWASGRGIQHRLKVPWQHADYVVSQLRSLVPGVRVTPEDDWPAWKWTRAVEVGLTQTTRTLRIFEPADVAGSLLASIQTLQDGEVLLMQWVVTPATPQHLPIHNEARSHSVGLHNLFKGTMASRDEVNDRRDKLGEPNMLAVLRVAAVASTDEKAAHLIQRVRHSLSSTRSPSSKFVKRMVLKSELQARIDHAAGVVNFPIQLSVTELSALIAWPIGRPHVAGLPQALSRHLPTPESVPRDGCVLGRSNFPGNERPVALAFEQGRKHLHVMGPTGVGKTVLLANLMRQHMIGGYGVVLIENKGDLFRAALDYVPKERMGDVIVLDVNDTARPVGFNIMQQGDSRVMIDELTTLFEHMYASGVWTRQVLFHGLRTLATDPRMTFVDLAPLLVPMSDEEEAWRKSLIYNLRDDELRNFWHQFGKQPRANQERIVTPVMDRIWQLNARAELRNVIGQSESSFQMKDVIRDNKILLVNLENLPRETASLAGTLMMNSLWHAVKTTSVTKPNFLYLDEFQDFLNLPIDPEDMLAKTRSYGLGMVLAHQHLEQLTPGMKTAIMANARSKVVFQTSQSDANQMAREFGPSVSPDDFMSLGAYEAIVRVATGDGVSPPLTMATSAPAPGTGQANYVRELSRNTYGRPLDQVKTEGAARRSAPERPTGRKPRIGTDQAWGT